MRVEQRSFDKGRSLMLCLVAESAQESWLIDRYLGKTVQNDDGLISQVQGEVRLSDGYGEHYIRLEKKI